jgi:hypothetical protein
MVTFLITSVLVLGLIAIAIYFWQKPAKSTETLELPPPPVTSLFAVEESKELQTAAPPVEEPQVAAVTPQVEKANDGKRLPDELLESWRRSPNRATTTQLIHAAALADNADTYRNVVEQVLAVWQEKGISEISAAELHTLINSEFWILSSAARSSGAGFVLKRTLSRAKRDLERANNPT